MMYNVQQRTFCLFRRSLATKLMAIIVGILGVLVIVLCQRKYIHTVLIQAAYSIECVPAKQMLLPYEPLVLDVKYVCSNTLLSRVNHALFDLSKIFWQSSLQISVEIKNPQAKEAMVRGKLLTEGRAVFFVACPPNDNMRDRYFFDLGGRDYGDHFFYPVICLGGEKTERQVQVLRPVKVSIAAPSFDADKKIYMSIKNGVISESAIYNKVIDNTSLRDGYNNCSEELMSVVGSYLVSSVYFDYYRLYPGVCLNDNEIVQNLRLLQPNFPFLADFYFYSLKTCFRLLPMSELKIEDKWTLYFQMLLRGETLDSIYDFDRNRLKPKAFELIRIAPTNVVSMASSLSKGVQF